MKCQFLRMEKHSIYENNFDIEIAFKEASTDYITSNKAEEDDLIRLTVYSQVVAGTNYKITFIDSKAEFPIIHEYIIYKPLKDGNKNDNGVSITTHKEYQPENGIIPFNDPTFDLIDNVLYKYLEATKEELKFISYVYPIENRETSFFLIEAYTSDGEHQYILCQDNNSKEYSLSKIK